MQKLPLLALGLAAGIGAAAHARPLTITDVASLSRINAADVSPDGHWLVWEQRDTDMAANKGRTDLWRLDLSKKGAAPEKLIAEPTVNEGSPAFSPDGKWLFYTADVGGKGGIWRIAITGGTAEQVSAQDVGGFKIAPTGDKLLVWADRPVGAKSLADTKPEKKDGGSGQIFDGLFIRHWDKWADSQRSQLFVLSLVGGKTTGDGVAIEGGLVGDTPSKPFGDGSEIAWSKDGKTVYFTLREAGRIEPLSTNLDIFSAPADGSAAPTNLTKANEATDTLPAVSPDGKWLAYVAMKRPTYEADRQVLMLRNLATGETKALTEAWDRSVASVTWSGDGKSIYVTAQDTGDEPAFAVSVATGKVKRLTGAGSAGSVLATPKGYVYTLAGLTAPADLYAGGAGKPVRLTWVNKARLADIDWPTVEHFSFKGANGDTVWAYAVKPAGIAPGARVPMAFLVHGGPQSSFGDNWSYRWNPAVWAGAGYGAVMVDFHGSVGYGQAFTDAINQNWGGWPLDDLKAGFAAATAKYSWLDGDNACAAGGSYGGYMMNWIAGTWPDRFKCIVTHDGVFDARAMAYETEELWFDEWEHGGPYFKVPGNYEKWNPVNHVAAWKTPMLIIHGGRDYRIPDTQGFAVFTAAQRIGVESRLLYFADENHWVLKPKNSIQWYSEVLGWMDAHTKK